MPSSKHRFLYIFLESVIITGDQSQSQPALHPALAAQRLQRGGLIVSEALLTEHPQTIRQQTPANDLYFEGLQAANQLNDMLSCRQNSLYKPTLLFIKQSCLMFKKLLAETRSMQNSHRPPSPLRSTSPLRLPAQDFLAARKDQEAIRSPIKTLRGLDQQSSRYLANHLQRKGTSPLKSPARSPSPLVRKNTEPIPNNRSPLKTMLGFGDIEQFRENRMPQSCGAPYTYIQPAYGKQNMKSNVALFATVVRDQNIKSQNCSAFRNTKTQKSTISFTSIIKKQQSLGDRANAQNQQSYTTNEKKRKDQGSVTTMDYSSGKKLSFKDSLKATPPPPASESIRTPAVILQKKSELNDSVGSISRGDRVNESVVQNSIMDLNMDPCFDM